MSVIDVVYTKEGFKDKILPTFGQKKKSDFSIILISVSKTGPNVCLKYIKLSLFA